MPKFADLNKGVSTLLGANPPDAFGEGETSLNYKFTAANGVKVNFEAVNGKDGLGFTNESEYATAAGVTLIEKFNSGKGTIDLTAKSKKLVPGLSISAVTVLQSSGGFKKGKELVIKGDYSAAGAIIDYKVSPLSKAFNVGATYGFDKWVAGATIDCCQEWQAAFGYSDADFTALTKVKKGGDYEVSVFHAASDSLKAGMEYKNDGTVSCGFSNQLDEDASLRGRLVAGVGQVVTVQYTQALKKNVELALTFNADISNLKGGEHTVGMGLTFSS